MRYQNHFLLLDIMLKQHWHDVKNYLIRLLRAAESLPSSSQILFKVFFLCNQTFLLTHFERERSHLNEGFRKLFDTIIMISLYFAKWLTVVLAWFWMKYKVYSYNDLSYEMINNGKWKFVNGMRFFEYQKSYSPFAQFTFIQNNI